MNSATAALAHHGVRSEHGRRHVRRRKSVVAVKSPPRSEKCIRGHMRILIGQFRNLNVSPTGNDYDEET